MESGYSPQKMNHDQYTLIHDYPKPHGHGDTDLPIEEERVSMGVSADMDLALSSPN
jgi:hypothetical protein